jgi:RND family efflux transporter MFP subunit
MKPFFPSLHLPTLSTRTRSREAGPPRSRVPAYLVVSLLSVATGVTATYLVLRTFARTPAAAVSAPPPGGHTDHQARLPGKPGGEPMPANAVQISPERQQLIGVRTDTIAPRKLESTIRTVGVLAYDETRTTEIHTKINGWVERLYVDYVGKNVRRGEPLFSIYSPDLVSTQVEYLIARKAAQAKDASPTRQRVDDSLVAATRKRLKLWDISDAQIAQLEKTEEPVKTMTLYSPFDGVVLERKTFAGQYVTPDMTTFKVADLSNIWVLGQIFEYELGRVKVGQEAEIQFPYGQTTRALTGKIGFIYPDVDPRTRTVKIRLIFKNPGVQLKPDSYVTVAIRTVQGEVLAVPKEAVIDTGTKQYVLLARGNGYFEPREVRVGEPQNDFYPVVKGIAAGDRVVTSAQFLIDSETNLQAAMKSMSMTMPGMKTDEGKDEMKNLPGTQKDEGKDQMKDMPGMKTP